MARTAESMDNVAVRLLTGMITALLAGAPMLTGCSRSFEGIAAMGPRGVDPAHFFAGDVPTYGQRLHPDEVTILACLPLRQHRGDSQPLGRPACGVHGRRAARVRVVSRIV
jgi:hypothetical protein